MLELLSSEDNLIVVSDEMAESESDDGNNTQDKKDKSVEQMECSLEEKPSEGQSTADESLEKMECSIDDAVSCPQTQDVSTFYFHFPNLAITNIAINISVCYTKFHRSQRFDKNKRNLYPWLLILL